MSDTGRKSSSASSKEEMDLEKASHQPELSVKLERAYFCLLTTYVLNRSNVNEARALEDMNDNVPRDKFAKLWAIVLFLDKYGVEARGIERVLPDERTQTCEWPHSNFSWYTSLTISCYLSIAPLAPFWMWLAANMTVRLKF